MTDNIVFVGDIGVSFELDMGQDLATWTNLKIKVKKPKADGSGTEEKDWTASQKPGVGNENILVHTSVSGELDAEGMYYLQPYGEAGGWKGRGVTVTVRVYPVYGK